MVWFVISGILIVISALFLIGSHSTKKRSKHFELSKKKSIGIVVGYDRKQQISANHFTCDLNIRIPEVSEKNVFLCKTSGVDPTDYPVGNEIDIFYARSNGRIPVVMAQLIESSPETHRTGTMLKSVGFTLVVISCIMIIVGIVTTLL